MLCENVVCIKRQISVTDEAWVAETPTGVLHIHERLVNYGNVETIRSRITQIKLTRLLVSNLDVGETGSNPVVRAIFSKYPSRVGQRASKHNEKVI